MLLSTINLNDLCKTAIEAAKKAGQLINEYADKNVTVQNKEGADSLASQVVTEVDLKAQDIILKVLSPTISKYDLALLTEESVDDKSRLVKDYFWCIDPMDGTLAFTEKTPGYAVSIGLVSKTGEPQIGVVFDPLTKTLYHAIKGEGAFKNEMLWKPYLSSENATTFTLFMDRSFIHNKNYEYVKVELDKFIKKNGLKELKIIKHAGAVLNACWVLENAPSCYFKFPKPKLGGGSLWDFAATACILKEARAFVSDCYGNSLDLNRSESTFMNYKGALFTSSEEIRDVIVKLNKMLS